MITKDDYRNMVRILDRMEGYGFRLVERHGYLFVGLDIKHDLWKDWGLVEDKHVSGTLNSLEEADAFVDGFLAYKNFHGIAKQPAD